MEQEKKAPRLYSGNAPDLDWECVEIFQHDGEEWHLYRRDGEGWNSFKLVSRAPVANKANYWFGWNGKRANNSTDWWRMGENRPQLQAAVMQYLLDI